MKFLTVFAAILAVALARDTWNVQQLSDALASPHTDAALKPYFEAALNQIMDSLWAGQHIEAVTITIPSASSGMSLYEISAALQNPDTDPALIPALEAALNAMMDAIAAGVPVAPAVVASPSMEVHYYTLHELSVILQDPATSPQLIPHFEHALNELIEMTFAGESAPGIIVVVPVLDAAPVDVLPAPVEDVMPVVPDVPEIPASPAAPASPASPLVQIIININQQEVNNVPALTPTPVETPVDPVQVVDDAINIIDVMPVVVPSVPVDVVDVMPGVVPSEPIDIVDVMPGVNPIVVEPIQVVDLIPVVPDAIVALPDLEAPVIPDVIVALPDLEAPVVPDVIVALPLEAY